MTAIDNLLSDLKTTERKPIIDTPSDVKKISLNLKMQLHH